MMNREQTVTTLKQKLDQWNSDLDELERKVESFKDDRRDEAQNTIKQLRHQRDKAKDAVERLATAGDQAFNDLRDGVQTSLKAMSESITQARQRYN